MQNIYSVIKQNYTSGDSTALFQAILTAAQEIGMQPALALLESCVIEKRLAWLENHADLIQKTDNPIQDGYHLFYENYLGVSIPQGGEIVRQNDREIVMRWWNRCPTLDACQKLGLDTRLVCRLAYHQPVQVFLAKINSQLQFDRNYESIRPYCDYCEEIISLK